MGDFHGSFSFPEDRVKSVVVFLPDLKFVTRVSVHLELIDIPYGSGSFLGLLFWTIVVGVAFSFILENGTEFVDLPRLINPYQDVLIMTRLP